MLSNAIPYSPLQPPGVPLCNTLHRLATTCNALQPPEDGSHTYSQLLDAVAGLAAVQRSISWPQLMAVAGDVLLAVHGEQRRPGSSGQLDPDSRARVLTACALRWLLDAGGGGGGDGGGVQPVAAFRAAGPAVQRGLLPAAAVAVCSAQALSPKPHFLLADAQR